MSLERDLGAIHSYLRNLPDQITLSLDCDLNIFHLLRKTVILATKYSFKIKSSLAIHKNYLLWQKYVLPSSNQRTEIIQSIQKNSFHWKSESHWFSGSIIAVSVSVVLFYYLEYGL